jgi:hypothetical protein
VTLFVYVDPPAALLARADGAHRYALYLLGKAAERGDWPRSRARALGTAACEHLEIAARSLVAIGETA